MKILAIISFVFLTLWMGCSSKVTKTNQPNLSPTELKAQQIIDNAIEAHGGKNYENLNLEFDFRKRHYRAEKRSEFFHYEKNYTDKSDKEVHDILNNESFSRTIDGEPADLTEKQIAGYSNSLNSVIYFVLLPYLLNDPAVTKNYIGEETINGTDYYKIKVTFKQDGGGKDFDDEYLYWINKKTNTMDYLAYNYQVSGGGARFRSAYNIRTVKGIRFADYINYKPLEKTMDINTFGDLFQNGGLEELSKIVTENIVVQ
jgi:Family of unknown function (DUF6503)